MKKKIEEETERMKQVKEINEECLFWKFIFELKKIL